MSALNNLGETLSTDVLIIGGGVSGLVAAIKAGQARPVNVLVVDKATPGFAGQGHLVAGFCKVLPTEARLEEWFEWKIESGEYLNDQECTYAIGKDMYRIQSEMVDWGAPFEKDEKGELAILRYFQPHYDAVRWASPINMMNFLRGKARSQGAKILGRTMVVHLLTAGERVVGAVGFNIDSGQFYILKAKATIIANGPCGYRFKDYFTTSSGEGIAMAYDVGAEMRNAEFANAVNINAKEGGWWDRGNLHAYLVNAKGENLCDKYGIDKEEENWREIISGMYREIQAGGAPIYWDGAKDPDAEERRYKMELGRMTIDKLGISMKQKHEFVPDPVVDQGAIKADLNCRTSVPGLWAAGDAIYLGSAFNGAEAKGTAPSEPLAFAEVTGYRAGLDAADFASEAAAREVDLAEVSRLKEQIYAPLERKQGVDPNDAIYQVQETVIPLKYSYFRSGERMQEALAKIEEVKPKLATLKAKDLHYLVKCHEAISMVPSAEMGYKAALLRQETRGAHIREDYPEHDDQNWLKWIFIKRKDQEMNLWTEPVPIDRYRFKLPRR